MKHYRTVDLARGGLVAALYVVLTLLAQAFGLASGAVQVRLSEALCLLPCVMPAAIPGLTLGCALANLLTGCAALDTVFGTLATMIGAAGTYFLRRRPRLCWIPPVLSNTLIVPVVLARVYGITTAWYLLALSVCAGELIACAALGWIPLRVAERILK